MKRAAIAAAASLALLGELPAANASNLIVWEQRGWRVATMTSDSGRFVGCAAEKAFARPIGNSHLILAVYRDNGWAGLVTGSHQGHSARSAAKFYVDGRLVHSAPSKPTAVALWAGVLPLSVIDNIITGRLIEVVTSAGRFAARLGGSAKALEAAVRCVNRFVAEERGSAPTDITLLRVLNTVSDGVLNMRARPTLQGRLIMPIPAGTPGIRQVGRCRPSEAGSSRSRWCPVRWAGRTGWVASSGVIEEVLPPAPAVAGYRRPNAPASSAAPGRAAMPSISTGTAFFVSTGKLLTNAHVVRGCDAVGLSQPGNTETTPATVLARDDANDLALLEAPGATDTPLPQFRRQIRLGDDVFVFGYPLMGLVASSGNFTRGNVTALAGLQDNTSQMQLAVPLQPGNSGGPVLDQRGAVVGVVVGKLDSLKVARATGSLPEQINFAIKGNTVLGFLEANGVKVAEATTNAPALNPPDLAERAQSYTVMVLCVGRDKS